MALYSVFITFVIFNLSIYFSHEISDKDFSQSSKLLRGLVARNAHAVKQPTKERYDVEVPRFLLDLYRQRTHLPRSRLSKRNSEIVRVFLEEPSGHDEHRGPLHRQIFFNLSAITAKEKIKKAELRIFKKKPLDHSAEGNFKIRLFRVEKSQSRSTQLKNKGVFVTSRLVSNKEKVGRWISFDITSVVKFWKEKPAENFGLRLSVQGFSAFPRDFRIGNRGRRAPFIVTYTSDPQVKLESTTSLKNCSNSQVREADDYFFQNVSTMPKDRAKRSAQPRRCSKRWVYVSFKKLKWHWIIAPTGYSANYCKGTCTTVLDITMNPTNHAILQNILHKIDSRIPSPSCVPTKLHSISVLYKTSNRSIALTEYGGMVVSTCGCH